MTYFLVLKEKDYFVCDWTIKEFPSTEDLTKWISEHGLKYYIKLIVKGKKVE